MSSYNEAIFIPEIDEEEFSSVDGIDAFDWPTPSLSGYESQGETSEGSIAPRSPSPASYHSASGRDLDDDEVPAFNLAPCPFPEDTWDQLPFSPVEGEVVPDETQHRTNAEFAEAKSFFASPKGPPEPYVNPMSTLVDLSDERVVSSESSDDEEWPAALVDHDEDDVNPFSDEASPRHRSDARASVVNVHLYESSDSDSDSASGSSSDDDSDQSFCAPGSDQPVAGPAIAPLVLPVRRSPSPVSTEGNSGVTPKAREGAASSHIFRGLRTTLKGNTTPGSKRADYPKRVMQLPDVCCKWGDCATVQPGGNPNCQNPLDHIPATKGRLTCGWVGCAARAMKKDAMQRHLTEHLNRLKGWCIACGEEMARVANADRHMKSCKPTKKLKEGIEPRLCIRYEEVVDLRLAEGLSTDEAIAALINSLCDDVRPAATLKRGREDISRVGTSSFSHEQENDDDAAADGDDEDEEYRPAKRARVGSRKGRSSQSGDKEKSRQR